MKENRKISKAGLLPYWNSDLDLEIAPWFPWGIDYQPVSANYLYSPQLRRIAAGCLACDSEFLFLASPQMGSVGSLMRDNFYKGEANGLLSLGFMMILGYSAQMERVVLTALSVIEDGKELSAGVAGCSLWNKNVLMGSVKAIALVGNEPFFDAGNFLNGLEGLLAEKENEAEKTEKLPFFAEKFGYRRFSLPYETDDPVQLRISRLLYEMEFMETRQMVGPSPEVAFPPFLGMTLGGLNALIAEEIKDERN